MSEVKLNDLDYSVLAILLDRELSGYDVTQRLKQFRNTSHSRIYPSLAKLESASFVTFRDVPQDGKPDKKLYKLTDTGVEILRDWIANDDNMKPPKVSDEEMMRLLCLRLLDKETSLRRLEYRASMIEKCSQKIILALEQRSDEESEASNAHPSIFLADVIRAHADFDKLTMNWIRAKIEGVDKPQSLREYIKEHL